MEHYDAIVIGAGQAGTPMAKRLARAGKKTLLIEKDQVGGSCINVGCTPTKTWVASARAMYRTKHAGGFGVRTGAVSLDMEAVWKRKSDIVKAFRGTVQKGIDATRGLSFRKGTASFCGHKTVRINPKGAPPEEVRADWIFIDTGSRPYIPEIPGMRECGYLTASEILELKQVPEHLIIIGGGYIGLEFGQMFRRFGSRVSIIEHSPVWLEKEDPQVRDALGAILEQEDVQLHLGAEPEKVERSDNGVRISMRSPSGGKTLEGTHLLLAAGRRGRSDALALEQTGLKADKKGYIPVDAYLETQVPGIFALGEINGGPAFTHMAYNDHVLVYERLMEGKRRKASDRQMPYCMYTDPQLGRVGLTEAQALQKGFSVKTAVLPMRQVGRAVETNNTRGLMKAVVDADTDAILGVSVLAAEGGEIMSILQMAMEAGFTYKRLQYFIFAHPAYAEAINTLFLKIK